MLKAITNPAQIITVNTNSKNLKRGNELSDIGVIENHSIIIEDGIIKDILPDVSLSKYSFDEVLEVKDMVVFPGFIDCHTHTVFAGSRAEEFKLKLAGKTYEEIAKAGGGINKTVNEVRKAGFNDLISISKPRIEYFISQGITTLEIKSGYGLDFENEIKLLRVINQLNKIFPIDIIPTFLGAHTFPAEYKNNPDGYVNLIIEQMLPNVAESKLAKFCDAYCEKLDFSSEQTDRIFSKAVKLGLKIKIHSEQFNNIGGIQTGLKHKAVSIDHLEVIDDKDISKVAQSDSVCVLLPGVSFSLRYKYAPARNLIDNDAIVAIATDYNPGSSHIPNLHLIMGLAAFEMRMTIEEIISAVTINAAKALERSDETGSIEINKKADLCILNSSEYSDIIYYFGKNLINYTIKNGNIIYTAKQVR